MVYGEKYRKILEFKMLDESNLTHEYLNGYPSCFLINGDVVVSTKNGCVRVYAGDIYCEEAYLNMKSMLKQCGARLHEINELNDWKGKGVDKI